MNKSLKNNSTFIELLSMNTSPKNNSTINSFISAFGILVRGFIITFMIFVLIESSLHYRRKPPCHQPPLVLQYNFTNDENQENTLVVMS